MKKTVTFRDFEERDIDFIYKCKNDKELNKLTVKGYKPFSYEDAVKWVHGCMGEHDNFKFWAVCTNDNEKRIVGWVSLSNIDNENLSACSHGIVIGDNSYRDGLAWIESILFIYEQVFEKMGFNRIYGSCRVDHKLSMQMAKAMFRYIEGVEREALYVDGNFIDVQHSSLLAREYFEHKNKGDYEISKIIRRLVSKKNQN